MGTDFLKNDHDKCQPEPTAYRAFRGKSEKPQTSLVSKNVWQEILNNTFGPIAEIESDLECQKLFYQPTLTAS